MVKEKLRDKSPLELASYIQFTQISPGLTRNEVIKHVELCKKYKFNAAMIAPCWVAMVKDLLTNTNIKTASFVDFGMGSATVSGKIALIKELINSAADEVDYAPNMGFFLSGMYTEFFNESRDIVLAANGMPVKAMLQLGMIDTVDEKKRAIDLLDKAGVDWIKNSSGGWPPGSTNATVDDICLIKNTISGKSRVKASGGINDYETAIALIAAGAELLGTSNGLKIIGVSENRSGSANETKNDY